MALKDWLKNRGGRSESLSADDLIALGRLSEAEEKLRSEVAAQPSDLHGRLRLADLLARTGQGLEARELYFAVADGHAREGFYDKARALLVKLDRALPGDEKVRLKIEALEQMKRVERRQRVVVGAGVGPTAFELKRHWRAIAKHPLIEALSDDQLTRLFAVIRMDRLDEGDRLVSVGGRRPEIFLIVEGEIAAQARLASGKRTDLRSFGGGQLIGDRALLEHQPWPADYVATKPSKVLSLTREGLEQALVGDSDPRRLLDALRMQRNDHKVVDAVSKLKEAG